jgi:S-methylmethionine-dependent homocysteine/selenocysteine methylase
MGGGCCCPRRPKDIHNLQKTVMKDGVIYKNERD